MARRKPTRPDRLTLYLRAVQHPQAEVRFLARAFARYHKTQPLLLCEDFAGSSAVAAAWCASHPQRQAMAIESHGPTLRWAARRWADVPDLHLVHADVAEVRSPRVDVIASLNFSTFIYHDRAALLAYFRHARRRLGKPGLLVLDCYGGPGAMRPGLQTRRVKPDHPDAGPAFTYVWEQRSYDAATARTDCRIHFRFGDGRELHNAFRYDWRLWTPPELVEILTSAGFDRVDVWCDRIDPATGLSDGVYRPTRRIPNREDWVAYVTAGVDGK